MGILKEINAGRITVGGVEYPAIYSFYTLALLEDELDAHFSEVPMRILGRFTEDDKGELVPDPNYPQLNARDTAKVVSAMIRAAGGNMTAEDVLQRTHGTDVTNLTMQAMQVIMPALPEPDEDKSKNAEA